jgi:CHAD domain-containing protein
LEQDIHNTNVKNVKWQKAIDHRFSKIEHVLHKLTLNYTADNIHDFRVEIKKLKALLRLFSFRMPADSSFRFPKPLNKLYKSLGLLREWQIQKHNIAKAADELHYTETLTYVNKINGKTDICKRRVMQKISKLPDLKKNMEQIKNNCPSELSPKSIVEFIQSKMHAVQLVLLNGEFDDKYMHDMRKKIKDVQYILSGSEKTNETNEASSRLQSIQKVSGQLGDYHDMSVSLLQLKKELKTAHKNPDEKRLLRKIEHYWQAAKLEMRQETILSVRALIQQHFPEFG